MDRPAPVISAPMTEPRAVPRSGDDSALPEDERAMLRAGAGIGPASCRAGAGRDRGAAGAGRDDRRVPRSRHPADPAAAAVRRAAGPVQPVLADRRGIDLWLRLVGLGLCGAGRASMDHRATIPNRRRSTSGATTRWRSRRRRWRPAPPPARRRRLAAERPLSLLQRLRLCAMGDPRRLSRRDRRPARTSPICWCRSPRSRSSTTGRCSGSPAPAASRWCCTMCSCPSTAA